MRQIALIFAMFAAGCSSSGKPSDTPNDAVATSNSSNSTTTPKATDGEPPSGDCGGKTCAAGQTCVSYYGIAGPHGPQFHDCVIPCKRGTPNDGCPDGKHCAVIADGPGDVCQ